MTKKTVGFVGGGRVARIFLEGWRRANALPENVVVSDCNAETLAKLKGRFPKIETAPGSSVAAASQDIVFLAVHPPVMGEVAGGIKDALKPGALVVSLAPKFTIAKLAALLGGFDRLARVIPNAPSVVNFGFNPVAFGPALTPEEKAQLTDLLAPLGECPEVAEPKLEGYALLTGMGPTYLWFQLQALREVAAGVRSGRSRGDPGPEADGVRRGANPAGVGPDTRGSDGPDSSKTIGGDGTAGRRDVPDAAVGSVSEDQTLIAGRE
jgi:pyrroline-5-carboxylate reductase